MLVTSAQPAPRDSERTEPSFAATSVRPSVSEMSAYGELDAATSAAQRVSGTNSGDRRSAGPGRHRRVTAGRGPLYRIQDAGRGLAEPVAPGYSRYVGRVGALAVALGVGVAIASMPGVAFADTGSDGSSAGVESRSPSEPADSPDSDDGDDGSADIAGGAAIDADSDEIADSDEDFDVDSDELAADEVVDDVADAGEGPGGTSVADGAFDPDEVGDTDEGSGSDEIAADEGSDLAATAAGSSVEPQSPVSAVSADQSSTSGGNELSVSEASDADVDAGSESGGVAAETYGADLAAALQAARGVRSEAEPLGEETAATSPVGDFGAVGATSGESAAVAAPVMQAALATGAAAVEERPVMLKSVVVDVLTWLGLGELAGYVELPDQPLPTLLGALWLAVRD